MRIGSVEKPINIAWYGAFGLLFAGAGVYILLGGMGGSWFGAAIFGGAGGFMLYTAAHAFLSRARYGEVALEVTGPVVPGGRLVARLDAPAGAAGATTIHAELRCVKVEWVHSGGKRSLSENALWTAKRTFPLQPAGQGARCDIAFDMPADAPLSDGSVPGIYWDLQIETENVAGVDLIRGFRFPVVAGAPAPSAVMRPSVPPVSLPEKAAHAAEAKKRYLEASKAAVYATVIGGVALFAYVYFGQPSGREMKRAFFALIAAPMLVYWVASYRNWLRDKVDNPDTPPLTGMFLLHGIVLAAAGWQLL